MIEQLAPGESVTDTADALRRRGRAVYFVADAGTKDDLLDAFARGLSFPGYFGRNLDALADCLADLPADDPATIIWQAATIERTEPKLFAIVTDILHKSLPRGIDVLICLG